MTVRALSDPRTTRLLSVALLWLLFGLALRATHKTPTFDEQGFLVRGLAYVRGDNRYMRVGHPVGLNAANALLLWRDPTVALPVDDPSWQTTAFHRPAELFMWEIGNDVAHVIFLARLPTVWLALLLAAGVSRWAQALARPHGRRAAAAAGLLALTLAALDPNLLAHGALTTTDFGLAALALAASGLLWGYLIRPNPPRAVAAGVGLGLLLNTKFTAGLFVPLLVLVAVFGWLAQWRRDQRPPWPMALHLGLLYPLAAFVTLWAGYGFDVGTLPAELPSLSGLLGGRTLPLAHYIDQLSDLGGRMQQTTPAFLLGNYSTSGWWYYFPVAFLLKTPLPLLLLLVGALVFGRTRPPHAAALLLPPLGFFAFAMTTDINIGYRHILTVVPFLAVAVGARLGPRLAGGDRRAALPVLALCLWLAVDVIRLAPDFLAYFNPLAGGPDNGWRALVDSNIDWGQDLHQLKPWMDAHGVDRVWLSYFGEGRPDYYGIPYRGLPSFPPRLTDPRAEPFYPHDPAPGVYAVSANNLQGVMFNDRDLLAWFRARPPRAKLGYSLFLYDVPARGAPVDLLLGGVPVTAIAPDDYARLGTNDVTLHWFDPQTSVLLRSQAFAALDQPPADPALTELWNSAFAQITVRGAYALYRSDAGPTTPPPAYTPVDIRLARDASRYRLHAYQLARDAAALRLYTWWENEGAPQPVRQFVHLVAADGTVAAQWDGLGAVWHGWQAGDHLVQRSTVPLPADLPPGDYAVVTGLYEPDGGVRWRSATADHVVLATVTLP